MPKKVLVLLAGGFEELEVVAPVDILRRGGVCVDVASVGDSKELTGRNQMLLQADMFLSECSVADYDMVVVPGGVGGVEALKSNERVLSLLREHANKNKAVGAICAGPMVLAAAGLLPGVRVTSHPGVRQELAALPLEYSESMVVEDGIFITSRGAGTALEFGFGLLEKLTSREKAEEIKKQIIYPEPSSRVQPGRNSF